MDLAVVGLGYVGLPLAVEASAAGLGVFGLDTNAALVWSLATGRSHISDVSDATLRRALNGGFLPSTSPAGLADVHAIVITVPTPLVDGLPDLSAVRAAAVVIGDHLRPGQLVVLESTSYPGTTEEVLQPILEEHSGLKAGADFSLAFSPERIDPGNEHFGIRNTPKIVGGIDDVSTDVASALYERFCELVVRVGGTREAELAKLIENTYRQVNIALVNEMLIFSHEMGINLWDSLRAAATKPFGFQVFYPGPGVGGHCIPIDPSYLSYKVQVSGHPFRFVELAMEINSDMPAYVVKRIAELLNRYGVAAKGSHVVLLGVAYKANVADTRETPARQIAGELLSLGASLTYVDPHVERFAASGVPIRREVDLAAALTEADLAVLLAAHSAFDLEELQSSGTPVLDTRGVLTGPGVEQL